MDALAALRLQLEWGVDECLSGAPVDRLSPPRGAPEPSTAEPPAPPRPEARPPAPRRAAGAGPAPADAEAAYALAAGAASLATLREAALAFDPDGLAATAISLVLPDRPAPAALAVVGDAPGADEDRAGRPFAGAEGRLLDAILASAGIDPARVLLCHAVPWRPPGGRPLGDAELAAYAPFLLRALALAEVPHVVAMGAVASRALFGRDPGGSRPRGRWRPLSEGEGAPLVLATYSPAQLLQRPDLKPLAWRDWRMVRRTLDAR